MTWKILFLLFNAFLYSNAWTNPETMNPDFTPDGQKLWEGDMLLSDNQVEMLYNSENVDLRKGSSVAGHIWPGGIVHYRLDYSSRNDKAAIEGAMNIWRTHTCLDFKEVEEDYPNTHIVFKKKTGCWSDVGRKWWVNAQELSLGYGCLNPGTIAHELGHAIGFHHEHSRPDRDKFIKIISDNYDAVKKDNFKKQQYIDNRNIPYDYGSIMHYSPYAFSNNDKKTICPLDPTKEFEMGQRNHLSFYDKKMAHIMYNCSGLCSSDIVCQNEGYLNSACQCVCKDGFTGTSCETAVAQTGCGGHFTTEVEIKSPNYPKPYPHDNKCIWWIEAPEGKKVEATFNDFQLSKREDEGDCYFDKFEVRTKDIFNGDTFCKEELMGKKMKSEGKDLVLVFTNKSLGPRGFSISVKFV